MAGLRENTAITIFLLAAVTGAVYLQAATDAVTVRDFAASAPPSQAFVRAMDIGLHSAVAAFLWQQNITDLPFLENGISNFMGNLSLINSLDPRFAFPYAYTVIAMPLAKKYPARIDTALEVGRRGVENADPDWRIPFYTAAAYQLDKNDFENAIKYYEITARTPGVPEVIARFAANFGASRKLRAETRRVWRAIYLSTDDKQLKERAKNVLDRLSLFDTYDEAVAIYHARFGKFPRTPQDMVDKGVITNAPPDPLGYPIYFSSEGAITLNKPADIN